MEGFFDLNNYDKMSDDMYRLGPNMVIRFNVLLNKNSEKYGKTNYHQEYEYVSSQTRTPVRMIRRSFDYYITVENERSTEIIQKDFANVRVQHMLKFIRFLEMGMRWFSSEEFNDIYQIKDAQLVLVKHPKKLTIDLDMNKQISIEPIVHSDRLRNQSQGVRISLNSDLNYCDLSLDKYAGLYYLMKSVDMYNIACTMVNYLNREMGENVTSFSKNQSRRQPAYIEDARPTTSGRDGRVPAYMKQKIEQRE